jgi:hypothetical protein
MGGGGYCCQSTMISTCEPYPMCMGDCPGPGNCACTGTGSCALFSGMICRGACGADGCPGSGSCMGSPGGCFCG